MGKLMSAALLLAICVYAADLPSLKEGLWSVHTTIIQQPAGKKADTTALVCRNSAYDRHVRDITLPRQRCGLTVDKSSGATKSYETECKVGSLSFRATERMDMGDETVSHMVAESTFTGPAGGMAIISDMTYVSPCPAGMKPGDVLMPDGTINHLPIP